jgi:hypothetical protein
MTQRRGNVQSNNLRTNVWPQSQRFEIRKTSSLRRTKLKLALAFFAWTLMGAALLLTGCATTSCEPAPKQPLPSMPAPSEQMPSESYSSQWKKLAEEWRKKLTFTHQTSKP